MRRLLSLLLLTLWLLMNGTTSYAFGKVSENLSHAKTEVRELPSKNLAYILQKEAEVDDKSVYYEEDEEDEEDGFHQIARLHAVILYQLFFLADAPHLTLHTFADAAYLKPSVNPVYLVCQNFRI